MRDQPLPGRDLLFRPFTVRSLTVPNRIVMSPMTRGFSPDGVMGEDVAGYYRRRAEGECGLIITEAVGVDHPVSTGDAGLDESDVPFLVGDKVLDGWRNVVAQVHGAGARIIPQLWHQGAMRRPGTGPSPELPSVSPSGLWGPAGRMTSIMERAIPADVRIGEPLSESEIEAIIDAFVRCAKNAIAVGCDGIALHGGHGYLIDQFLWAETNQRTDQWGGSPVRRTRFATEIVRRIRAVIGEAYPIFFRFSQWKLQDFKGRLADTPDELAEVLGPLADAGVDVFDASIRYFDSPAFEGSNLNLAGWAKKLTCKASMTVGGVGINRGKYDTKAISDVSDNVDLLLPRLGSDEFDLVAVGRALMGDPQWAAKVRRREAFRAYDSATDDQVLT